MSETATALHLAMETTASALAIDIPDDFTLRLKAIVARAGSVSALAKKAGISHSGLLRYLGGGDPSRKVLVALSQAAKVDLAWLATGQGEMTSGMPKPSLTQLPLYHGATDNSGSTSTQATEKAHLSELAFCRFWLKRNGLDASHLTAMTMPGDCMAPHFQPGDTLLIDITKKELADGKVYLLEDSGNLLLRRIQIEIGGRVRLVSDNPAYRSYDVEAASLQVIGSVVWSARLA